jgi:hypothetical protein
MKPFPIVQTYFQQILAKCQNFMSFLAKLWHSVLPELTYAEWLFLEDKDQLENETARGLGVA